jgi:hypothetical protein
MAEWRTSNYSDNGKCVQVAAGDDVLVRNSNHPGRRTLVLSGPAVAAFVAACSAGELDDLAVGHGAP